MLNRYSEIVICSRFLNCELWSCDMNSALGSVVPLAMFLRIKSLIGSQGPCSTLSAAATLTHFLLLCNLHKCIFVREPNKHINCSLPLLLVTSLNILQLGWYVCLAIYCISQTSAVMMLTKNPFSKKFKPPFFLQTSASFLSQIDHLIHSQASLCFEWIFHQFFALQIYCETFCGRLFMHWMLGMSAHSWE